MENEYLRFGEFLKLFEGKKNFMSNLEKSKFI